MLFVKTYNATITNWQLGCNFNRCLLLGFFSYLFNHVLTPICPLITSSIKFCKSTGTKEDKQYARVITFAVTVHCPFCS